MTDDVELDTFHRDFKIQFIPVIVYDKEGGSSSDLAIGLSKKRRDLQSQKSWFVGWLIYAVVNASKGWVKGGL